MNKSIAFEFGNKVETMELVGIGAYPYECAAKDACPNSAIYRNESGGWVPSHDMKQLGNGNFTYKWNRSQPS